MKFSILYPFFFTLSMMLSCSETIKNKELENQNSDINQEDLSILFAEFIPENHEILNTAFGDLNLDGISDVALVLKQFGEDTIVPVDEYNYRPLLLILQDEKGVYRLARRNDKVVYCYECGGIFGDPFYEISIQNGQFTAYHYGGSNWRWTRDLTFKYDQVEKEWFIHSEKVVSFNVFEPEKADSTIRTAKDIGKIRFSQFNVYED